MSNLRDFTGKSRKFTGTTGIIIPQGTSGQRAGSPTLGTLRYNTDADKGFLEQYNAAGWGAIDAPPQTSSITPDTFDGNTNTDFLIAGSNFKSNSTIELILADGSTQTPASTTFISSSSMGFSTSADIPLNQSPISVKVNNPSGLSSTLSDGVTAGTAPTFSSPAANTVLATLFGAGGTLSTSTTTQIVAADSEDSTAPTLTMPANIGDSSNLSIDANGYIIGTKPSPTTDTTYTFTVTSTDVAGNTATRNYRLSIDLSYTGGGNYLGDGSDG